jgi:hypothetical protein
MTVSLITKGMICQGNMIVNIIQKYVLPFAVRLKINPIKANIKVFQSIKATVKSIVNPLKIKVLQNLFKVNITKISSIKIKIKKICG